MSLYRDKAVRDFFLFLVLVVFAIFLGGIAGCRRQIGIAKDVFLAHDSAVAESLMALDVPEEAIASVVTSTEYSERGKNFLIKIGVTEQTDVCFLPFLSSYQRIIQREFVIFMFLYAALLLGGAALFLKKQEELYRSAADAVRTYMADGDFRRLPQLREGAIYEMFSEIDRLLTMQRSKNETEQRTKQFLKNTISDISHQLKTPLAALFMYQEIIEEEPENLVTVKEFSEKIKAALVRIERLIQLMLKITRLDAGSITFEKRRYYVSELIWNALDEFTVRAEMEGKELTIEEDETETIVCDMEWTKEAVVNVVKNALDHTSQGDHIHISWERSPDMLRLFISDDGCGISDEDIHHIFKRFYRSKSCSDQPGIGLGLPLVKEIVEGQDGVVSVSSNEGEGTLFTISLPCE